MSHVFISYSKQNKEYAQALKNQFLALGFDVWIDEVIDPGDDWWRNIRQAIKTCAAFVLIMTPQAEESHWVGLELLHALEYRKPIFPLLCAGNGNLLESDAWSRIANIQYTDVRDGGLPPDRFYAQLVRVAPHKPIRGIDLVEPSAGTTSNLPNAMGITGSLEVKKVSPSPSVSLIVPDVSAILPPPFEWCEIPAGEVTILYTARARATTSLPAFAMSKYPITNTQYDVFVAAKDGYRDAGWWDYSEYARQWRRANGSPPARDFDLNDLPRTNVTWYEALAFCQWLAARVNDPYERARKKTPRFQILLPTEQQWQRAAQGDESLEYPWGNSFNAERCNTLESGIGGPTPVTQYGEGASPYGVMDMAGNVAEWCLTGWETRKTEVGTNEPRVRRGGAFDQSQQMARCSSRERNFPDNWTQNNGFRIVCVNL